jgi:hypothetical protein
VSFRAILTEIRTSGAQGGPREDVATVGIEYHRLVNESMSSGHQSALTYVRLYGGKDDILRLVYLRPSREIWARQVWNMIVFHFAFPLGSPMRRSLAFGFYAYVGACALTLSRYDIIRRLHRCYPIQSSRVYIRFGHTAVYFGTRRLYPTSA